MTLTVGDGMKTFTITIVAVIAALAVNGVFAGGSEPIKLDVKPQIYVDLTKVPVCEMTTTITTNTVGATDYNVQTNGYRWQNITLGTDAPRFFGLAYNVAYMATNNIYVWGQANNIANIPDPFAEKVTTVYTTVLSNDVYTMIIGPITNSVGDVHTVLARWKTVTRQKISQHESTETIKE
jgi:hypothetical protein